MKLPEISVFSVLLMGSFLFVACSEEPSIQKYKVSKTPVPAANSAPSADSANAEDTGLPFTWVVPDGWEAGKVSSMRLASYNVPLSNGEAGDFSLVQLGGGAGGVMPNINRWRGQIGLGPAVQEELAEYAHEHATPQGRQYLYITLINEENPDNAILGAIFEETGYMLFAKMTASRAGVEEAQESFEAFCNSLHFKDA
ncbi:MAG: hypothetical protein O7C75_08015 [Verrucomicrobia bacterium]|nr:hypothetical protein [Verrucomicrobiota bacterium]